MAKYIIFVKDEKQSREVQELLFAAGYGWSNGYSKTIKNTDYRFLYTNSDDSDIACGNRIGFVMKSSHGDSYIVIDSNDVSSIFTPKTKKYELYIDNEIGFKINSESISEVIESFMKTR